MSVYREVFSESGPNPMTGSVGLMQQSWYQEVITGFILQIGIRAIFKTNVLNVSITVNTKTVAQTRILNQHVSEFNVLFKLVASTDSRDQKGGKRLSKFNQIMIKEFSYYSSIIMKRNVRTELKYKSKPSELFFFAVMLRSVILCHSDH